MSKASSIEFASSFLTSPNTLPSETKFLSLVSSATPILAESPNVLMLPDPVVGVGNLCGDPGALYEILELAGEPPEVSYVFFGGVLSQNPGSLAVLSLLLSLVVAFPSRVFLLRSGHESRAACEIYGLYEQIIAVYGSPTVFDALCDLFVLLPIGAIVSDVLLLSGGLSPSVESLDGLQMLNRAVQLPPEGALTDIMWSIPDASGQQEEDFLLSPRGLGYCYSFNALNAFLSASNLAALVTGNALNHYGFEQVFPGRLFTLWSAPNYLGRCGNLGAILHILPQDSVPFPHQARPLHHVMSSLSAPFPSSPGSDLLPSDIQPDSSTSSEASYKASLAHALDVIGALPLSARARDVVESTLVPISAWSSTSFIPLAFESPPPSTHPSPTIPISHLFALD